MLYSEVIERFITSQFRAHYIHLSPYLPSGACHEGCPILCFPSSGLRHLVDDAGWEDFDTTITYMKSLLK